MAFIKHISCITIGKALPRVFRSNPLLVSKQSLLFFILTVSTACNSAIPSETNSTLEIVEPSTPAIRATKTVADFVLEGYEILAQKEGDLNGDSYQDAVLILKAKNEVESSNYAEDKPSLRPLLVLTGDAQGSLNQVARNDQAVYCVDCGGQMGDAFSALVVTPPYFTIEHYGGSAQRWARMVTFTYKDSLKGWYLHNDSNESFDVSSPQDINTKETTPTGVLLESFDIYQ